MRSSTRICPKQRVIVILPRDGVHSLQVQEDSHSDLQAERKGEIEAFVLALNDAWLDGNYDELQRYFAEDCVLLPPGGSETVVGADLIIESYRQFGEIADIEKFAVSHIEIFPIGEFAMVHLKFQVDYSMEDEQFQESGVDVYAIRQSDAGNLQVVWRTQKTLD